MLCKIHQGQQISHICCLEDCLTELCPKCIKQHNQKHKEQNEFTEIETIEDIKIFSQEKLQQVLQEYKQELENQKQKEIQLQKNSLQSEEGKKSQLGILQNAKKQLLEQIEHYFEELEKYEKDRIEKSQQEIKNDQTYSNNLKKQIEQLQSKLKFQSHMIQQGNIQIDQIRDILVTDYSQKLEDLKQQEKLTQQQNQVNSSHNLQQKQCNLYIDPQHLERNWEFLKQMYFWKNQELFDYLNPKKSAQQIKRESQQQFQQPFTQESQAHMQSQDLLKQKLENFQFPSQLQQTRETGHFKHQSQLEQINDVPTPNIEENYPQLRNNQQNEQNKNHSGEYQYRASYLPKEKPKIFQDQQDQVQKENNNINVQQQNEIKNPYIQENQQQLQQQLQIPNQHQVMNTEVENFDKINNNNIQQQQQEQFKVQDQQDYKIGIQSNNDININHFDITKDNFFNYNCNKIYMHFFQHKSKIFHFVNLEDLSKNLPVKFYQIELDIKFKIPRWHKSIALPDGNILLTGGVSCEVKDLKLNSVYILSMENKTLYSMPSMILGRSGHALVYFQDELYAIGGLSQYQNFTQRCEKYDFQQQKWVEIAQLQQNSNNPCVCNFNDQYIYKFGGKFDDFTLNKVVEKYDPILNHWEVIKFYIPSHLIKSSDLLLNLAACCQINEQEILVFGGTHEEYCNKSDQCYILRVEDEQLKTQEIEQYIQQYNQKQNKNENLKLSTYIQRQLDNGHFKTKKVYSIVEYNSKLLPQKDGFWNNQVFIHNNNLYCLQNVSSNNQQSIVNLDRRRILQFDSNSGWSSLNEQSLVQKELNSQNYYQQSQLQFQTNQN